MTKHFPAVCTVHTWIQVMHSDGIGRHREFMHCYATFLSIHSKAYRKWKKKQDIDNSRIKSSETKT